MTAVRDGARDEPGKATDLSDVHMPTDVMAITSLPSADLRRLGTKKGQHVVLSLPPTPNPAFA